MCPAVGFVFPYDQSDQWDGFNDSGIEHFAGNPYPHLGREVVQNTLDARQESSDAPAHIIIQVVDIETNTIPDIQGLREAMAACRQAAEQESEKARVFFQNATELLTKSKIKVLKISDYNTIGVQGPCENGSPYYALLKASGQSKKSHATAAGSYGIGKYAPYAVSDLRTVFVTTVWEGGDGWHQYVQGKSILMSHKVPGGRTRDGVGFWGIKERCQPVEPLGDEVPGWLLRAKSTSELAKNVGTTLSILAFPAEKTWDSILAATIVENFFGAISRGQLDVVIQGETFISRDNLEQMFADLGIRSAITYMKDQPEHFDEVAFYLKALAKSDDVIVEQTENQHLGNCELRILLGENLPKRVAVLRNGMLITEDLEGLRRFGDFKGFVAVLECMSTKGNELLRAMEPPRHDDFEPERLPTERDKRRARTALRELSKWVKDMLKRHAQNPVTEVSAIDELAEYFADDGSGGTNTQRGEEDPSGRLIIRARSLRRKDRPPTYVPTTGADGEGGDLPIHEGTDAPTEPRGPNNRGDDGTAHGGRAGDQGKGNYAPSRVNLENVRAIPVSPTRRKIAFTPDASGEVVIGLDSGADANYRLDVVFSSLGDIRQGRIEKITVTAGHRYIFEVELEREFRGAVKVVANAI